VRFQRIERKIPSHGASLFRRIFPPFRTQMPGFRGTVMKAVLLSLVFMIGGGSPADAKEKIRVGAVENVVLLPWGVVMPARIATGAATSSLDARDITVKGKTVEFHLPQEYGGQKVRLPIVRWRTIKSAEARDRRPVVAVEMCIGSKRVKTQVNLNDRSNVKYPLLIGRNTLDRDFVVDCGTSFCAEPSCPEVAPK